MLTCLRYRGIGEESFFPNTTNKLACWQATLNQLNYLSCNNVNKVATRFLPLSHWVPVKPAVQKQRYPWGSKPDWHVPWFRQGIELQEFFKNKQNSSWVDKNFPKETIALVSMLGHESERGKYRTSPLVPIPLFFQIGGLTFKPSIEGLALLCQRNSSFTSIPR